MSSERREFKRFDVDPLLCETHPASSSLCVLRNVSLNGAFFLNQNPPPVGSPVNITFAESPLEGYKLTGHVSRLETGLRKGFGVIFKGPHPRLLKAVYDSAMAE
jgi:hypothetical protein